MSQSNNFYVFYKLKLYKTGLTKSMDNGKIGKVILNILPGPARNFPFPFS